MIYNLITIHFPKSGNRMKLFAIRDLTTGRVIPDLFFSDKAAAKRKRNELGPATHCVTYGPDHRRFKP